MIEELSKKQLQTLVWWCDSSPYRTLDAIICDGAVRSGKTLCMGLSFFCWAMRRFSGMQFGLCGKTIVSLRRNFIAPLLPLLGRLGFSCEEKISQNLVIVRCGERENRFFLFGGKDEGSAALIQGATFAGVLMYEAALMPRSFIEQACARCSVEGSKLWFNCNPENPQHWFYLEWVRRAEERRALYLHFTMEDNPSLSQEMRDRYRKMYSGVFYRRFILGEWVAAQGRVYDFFDESFVMDIPEEPFEQFAVSCDYGTANPASFGLWGKADGRWFRIREYYFDSRREGMQKTDEEYVSALLELIGGRSVSPLSSTRLPRALSRPVRGGDCPSSRPTTTSFRVSGSPQTYSRAADWSSAAGAATPYVSSRSIPGMRKAQGATRRSNKMTMPWTTSAISPRLWRALRTRRSRLYLLKGRRGFEAFY